MRNVGIFPRVILICELSEFPGSCKHFPSGIMCNISKTGISSFKLKFLLTYCSQLQEHNSTAPFPIVPCSWQGECSCNVLVHCLSRIIIHQADTRHPTEP